MKKIGMFLGQINLDSQRKIIKSVYQECKKHNIDCTVFSFYSSLEDEYNQGEFECFERIDMDSFDGFILYVETIYSQELREKLINKVSSYNKHIVSIDYEIDGVPNIKTDNYYAMKELTEKLIKDHNIKKVNFIGGPVDSTDSINRLRGVKKALEKSGLEISDNRIFYGDFLLEGGKNAIDKFNEDGVLDADVYICANDQMALGAIRCLKEHGLKVPDDCKLTGFDNIEYANSFSPSITSIERREEYIGKLAFEQLIALSQNKEVKNKLVKAKPVFRGSCSKEYEKEDEGKSISNIYLNSFIDLNIDLSKLATASEEFNAVKSMDALVSLLPKYLNSFNVNEMCLCIDSQNDNSKIDIPLHFVKKGNICYSECIEKKDVMPKFVDTKECNSTIIVPLHYNNIYFGYIVTNNCDQPLNSAVFRILVNNISNALDNIRREELNYLEHLTGHLNRKGFEVKAVKLFNKCVKDDKSMFVIFTDLDGLKSVNDGLGHEAGDSFICSYANALRNINKKYNFLIWRYGGDEFVIFGSGSKEKAVNFITELEEYIDYINGKCSSDYGSYKLSTSIGLTVIDNKSKKSIFNYIAEADHQMYLNKQQKKTDQSPIMQNKELKKALQPQITQNKLGGN